MTTPQTSAGRTLLWFLQAHRKLVHGIDPPDALSDDILAIECEAVAAALDELRERVAAPKWRTAAYTEEQGRVLRLIDERIREVRDTP